MAYKQTPYKAIVLRRLEPKARSERIQQSILPLSTSLYTILISFTHTLVDAPCERFHRFHVAEHLVVDRRDLDSHGRQTRIAFFIVNAPAARRMALLTVVFQVKPSCFLIGIANRIRHPRDRLRTVVELDLVVGLKGTAGKSAIRKRKRKHGKHDAFHG